MSCWVMIPALDCSTSPPLESCVIVIALQPAGLVLPTQMGLLSFLSFRSASTVTTAVLVVSTASPQQDIVGNRFT